MAFTIEIDFKSLEHMKQEYKEHLYNGGVFAPGAQDASPNELGTMVLVHPVTAEYLLLPAKAVWVNEQGVGLALVNFSENIRSEIRTFVESDTATPDTDASMAPEANSQDEPAPDSRTSEVPTITNPMVALKGLNAADLRKKAKSATLSERKALERIYGKSVWDALLRNPQITIPEVAQMAQKGTLPRPLIERIAGNNTWLSSPLVRRALLSNPKLGGEYIMRVLRMTPPNELKLIPRQTGYSQMVRQAAKKLTK